MNKTTIAIIGIFLVGVAGVYAYTSYQPPANLERANVGSESEGTKGVGDSSEESLMDGRSSATESSAVVSIEDSNITILKRDGVVTILPGEGEIDVDVSGAEFFFTGYSVGKEHEATFDEMEAKLRVKSGVLEAAVLTIDPASVNTGIERLDTHLKSEDFFDVATYPRIMVSIDQITGTGEERTAQGTVSFRGIEQPISFPLQVTDNAITADFLMDTEPFDFKYTGVNDDVRIVFSIKIS